MANVTTINVPAGDFVTSTLNGAITSASTSFTIGSGLTLDTGGGFLQIDYDSALALGVDGGPETIAYTSYNSGTGLISGVTRAQAGTTAVAHANGTTVQCGPSSMYYLNGNVLGYAQITTSATSTNVSPVAVSGLTATVTVPAGGRRVKITVYALSVSNTNSGEYAVVTLWDGTVGSGTQISKSTSKIASANAENPMTLLAVVTPAAGAKTYNVGLNVNAAGTATITAATTAPAFILVELL